MKGYENGWCNYWLKLTSAESRAGCRANISGLLNAGVGRGLCRTTYGRIGTRYAQTKMNETH